MESSWPRLWAVLLATCGVLGGLSPCSWAAPTAEEALSIYTPIQQHVEYSRPASDELPRCTIRAEKDRESTAWVVRDSRGETLRRFGDTNADNTVDIWCYYLNGLEVYRDIDSDYNRRADQYRWFHTAGTRWGIDSNEDNQIDAWQVITPSEVAEELVLALRTRDSHRFSLLLLKPQELSDLSLGKQQADAIAAKIRTAESGFQQLSQKQKTVTSQSTYVDFDSARPGTIPAGTGGSAKDVTICENASALIATDGKNDQVFLGTLVAVGNTWKMVDLPVLDSNAQPLASGFVLAASGSPAAAAAGGSDTAPNEEMQQLMAELEKLDLQANRLPPDKQGPLTDRRADVLMRLADVTTDAELRSQWYRQLADMVSVAIQSAAYPQGIERLEELEQKLADAGVDDDVIAHVEFQRLWAEYSLGQQQPDADPAKVQEKWLTDLEKFAEEHPRSQDSAEALLQLGMYREFVGKTDEALEWYRKLTSEFPDSQPASKAKGAVRRLDSVGKPIRLRGQGLDGRPVDLAALRGKLVLIHYWATWCEPCKGDMAHIQELYAKNRGRGFEVIGVVLDESPAAVKQFLSESRYRWMQIQEPGGLDGRLANEMGVMTLPLMILVDQRGNVVSHNIHAQELNAELARLLK